MLHAYGIRTRCVENIDIFTQIKYLNQQIIYMQSDFGWFYKGKHIEPRPDIDCPHHIGIRYPMTFNFQLLILLNRFFDSILKIECTAQVKYQVPTYVYLWLHFSQIPNNTLYGNDWSFMEFNYRTRDLYMLFIYLIGRI